METFGERMRALRLEKGFSTYAVEKESDLDSAYLSRIELGKTLGSEKAIRALATLYGVEYERLRVWKALSKLSEREIEILKEELTTP